MPSPRSRILVVAAAAVLVLTGCGGGGDDGQGVQEAMDAVAGLTGKARTAKLLELAEAEGGELSLYTSLTADTETAVGEAFEGEYGIEVSTYRSKSEAVAQRVSEEADAGFHGADVVETGGGEMATLADQGIFTPYDTPYAADLVEGSVRDGWIATRYNRFVVSWNTDLVPEGEEPKSFEDLADPRWKGKVAIELGDSDWYKTLRDHWISSGKSEDETDALLEGIARNSRVVSSHNLMAQLLAAGEFQVAASNYIHLARDTIDDGAPVSFEPFVEPVLSRPQGIGIVSSARHPASALLFVDWLLSDGQKVLVEHNVDPAREGLGAAPEAEVVVIDIESFVAEQEEWTDRYDRLVSLGARVEGE
jgi:iron(III) transport system substrate-binding protein